MSVRPWFAFYPADYLAATRDLDHRSHGIYLLLLMESWRRGPLPDDGRRLRAWCCGAPEAAVRDVLSGYWTLTERGWINPRLEEERAKADARSEVQRQNVSKRWRDRTDTMVIPSYPAGMDLVIPTPIPKNTRARPSQSQSQEDLEGSSSLSNERPPDPVESRAEADVSTGNGRVPYGPILEAYHQVLVPPLAKVLKLTPGRKQAIAARWREDLTDLDDWQAFFAAVKGSRLPRGFRRPDGSYWRPDLAWLIKPENFARITEGQYG